MLLQYCHVITYLIGWFTTTAGLGLTIASFGVAWMLYLGMAAVVVGLCLMTLGACLPQKKFSSSKSEKQLLRHDGGRWSPDDRTRRWVSLTGTIPWWSSSWTDSSQWSMTIESVGTHTSGGDATECKKKKFCKETLV